MILVEEKLGALNAISIDSYEIDAVLIEWYETKKRILHKQTKHGREIAIKFLHENPNLKEGDILWQDGNTIIAIEINPFECIVIKPGNMFTASSLCYEIGNRHLPLFYEEDELLVPYDMPLHNLLQASGHTIKVEKRKLNNALNTTVLPHLQVAGADSLFSKILQTTTSS